MSAQPNNIPIKVRKRSRFRSILKWASVLLLVILLLGTAVGLGARRHYLGEAERGLAAVIEGLDRDDPGWKAEEIEAARRVVAEEDNPARFVVAAADCFPRDWRAIEVPGPYGGADPYTRMFRGGPANPIEEHLEVAEPPELMPESIASSLQSSLDKLQPALAHASRLIDCNTEGRYSVTADDPDYFRMMMPHLGKVTGVAHLLTYRSAFHLCQKRTDESLADSLGCISCARTIGDEPTVRSMLVRAAVMGIAIRGIERALAQGVPSSAQLERLQGRLLQELEDTSGGMRRVLHSERADYFRVYRALGNGDIGLDQFLYEGRRSDQDALEHFRDWALVRIRARTALAIGLRFQTESLEITNLPPHEQLDKFAKVVQEITDFTPKESGDSMKVASHIRMPAFYRIACRFYEGRARIHCALIALSAERFRLNHRRWPTSLDELAGLPGALLADPFTGRGLSLARHSDGMVIYSLGLDREDDEGDPRLDLCFRLWDPDKRRQPPPKPPVEDRPIESNP